MSTYDTSTQYFPSSSSVGGSSSHNNTNNTNNSKKRRLLKKAPDAPKRFKSAYICFIGEKMEQARTDAPGLGEVKVTDTMKVLASQWKALPPEQKLRYEAIAEADKAR